MMDISFPQQAAPLLSESDPPPFTVVNDGGRAPFVLLCDHAGLAFPAALGTLGLGPADLSRHIAYDIGAADATRYLAQQLDAPAVLATYSRLVIDPNRSPDDPSSIPEVSDGTRIPGNLGLSASDRAARRAACFDPYHAAVAEIIGSAKRRTAAPAILSIHSCTDVMDGFKRPWEIGVLYDQDTRIAGPLIDVLRRRNPDFQIGDNQPYSGSDPKGYTLDSHAVPFGLPHVGIELRQDLIGTRTDAERLAEVLRAAFAEVLADAGLYRAA